MTVLDHDQLILQAQDLQPLPVTAIRLASLVADPNTDMRDIVESISLDQALTVRLLRVANSAANGGHNEIKTVDQAVVRVGTGAVLSMAVAAGVKGRMMGAIESQGLAEGVLWQHSVAAALVAESMAGITQPAPPPEIFTAALLHDVGRLVLGRFVDRDVRTFLHQALERSPDGGAEESEDLLEVHHGELGGLIAEHWKLPQSICVGIRYHHDPDHCVDDVQKWMPWFVHLADLVARKLGRGLDDTVPDEAELAPVLEKFGMDDMKLEKLMYRASLRLDEVGERFG